MKEVIFLLLCCVVSIHAQRKYLALMAKKIRPGEDYHIDVVVPGATQTTKVTAGLYQETDPMSAPAWRDGAEGSTYIYPLKTSGRITLNAPMDLVAGSKYFAYLGFDDERMIEPGVAVEVDTIPNSHLIQTDKGIYKPGELVKIRVLLTDMYLKPIVGRLNLQIKNSKDMIVSYLKNLDAVNGLAESEFLISKDPAFGTYTAFAETTFGMSNVTFEVSEYKLPKFGLDLVLTKTYVVDPFYFDSKADGTVYISGKVTARYTYGALVKGKLKVFVDGVEKRSFPNFSGEDTFNIEMAREKEASNPNSYEVYAEIEERFTEDKANATAEFSVHDALYKTLTIKPISYTVEGDTDYGFFAKMIDASGQKVEAIDEFRWVVTATMKYQDSNYRNLEETSTYTSQELLFENPVFIMLPTDQSKMNAYYSNIEVTFEEIATGRKALSEEFKPLQYTSNSKRALFIDIVDRNTQDVVSNTKTYELSSPEVCFIISSNSIDISSTGETFYQVIGNRAPGLLTKVENLSIMQCIVLSKEENAPKSMIMAYWYDTSKNNEVLAASVTIQMEWTSPHEVSLRIEPEVQRPGMDATIFVEAQGSSIIGLSGVDKSLLYLAGTNDITNARLLTEVEKHCPFCEKDETKNNWPRPMPMFRDYIWPMPEGPTQTSAGEIIKNGGLQYLSSGSIYDTSGSGNPNIMWERQPVMAMSPNADGSGDKGVYYYDDAEFMPNRGVKPGHRPISPFERLPPSNTGGGMEEEDATSNVDNNSDDGVKKPQKSVRTEFPESWLFDVITTGDNGKAQLTKTCPGTITNWVINAFAVNSNYGVGVAPTKELKCFQSFFIRLNLPYAIVRGELFTLQILVFNYGQTKLTVSVILAKTADFDTEGGPTQRAIEIESGDSALFEVPIRAKVLGEIDLSVTGRVGAVSDTVKRKLKVKSEGKEIRASKELQARVTADDPSKRLIYPYALLFSEPEEDVVKDSVRGYLLVSGDMLATLLDNLEGNIHMPTGCGEQNMIGLVPSLAIAKYFKALDRFGPDIAKKVAKYTAVGYAKELNFRHYEGLSLGGFSAFGEKDNGCGCWGDEDTGASCWLTAFVLKIFSQIGQEKLTFVSSDIMRESFEFFKRNVDRGTSADSFFRKCGQLFHDDMAGGTGSGPMFTAYVMIAILEYKKFIEMEPNYPNRADHIAEINDLIEEAKAWLLSRPRPTTKFALSIMAYAFVRAEDYVNAVEFIDLSETATQPREYECPRVYRWAKMSCAQREENAGTVTVAPCTELNCPLESGQLCCNTSCGSKEKCVQGQEKQSPSDVEIAGYKLMTYVGLPNYDVSYQDKARLQADILLQNRKEGGRMHSTQDTVVSMEALAAYAIRDPDQAVANFRVSVSGNDQVGIDVDSSNYEIVQRKEIPIEWQEDMYSKSLEVDVLGTGSAFVTALVIYSSKNNQSAAKVFDISTDSMNDENTGEITIKNCITVVGDVGNMAVYNLNLESGTIVPSTKVNMQELNKQSITRMEISTEGDSVSFYLEFNDNNKKDKRCWYVPIEREFQITDYQPANAEVYDYYNPQESRAEAFYMTEPCMVNCGAPTTTPRDTTGASSIYISGVLLIFSLLVAFGVLMKKE